MNKYWKAALDFQKYIEDSINVIFKVYGNELILKLEELNLLQNERNCIESSTSIGFILEEFIVSKLEIFTSNSDIKIERSKKGTTLNSYDCFSTYEGDRFLINIKANKIDSISKKGNNNAIAAINKLYNDYIHNKFQVHYLVLKINYYCGISKKDNKTKKIIIDGIESFYLEEIDFSEEYKKDNRNWSTEFKNESGRLQVSKKFYLEHLLDIEKRSYEYTRDMIIKMYKDKI